MWEPVFVTNLVIPLAGMATGIILGYPVVKAVVRAFENRAGRRGLAMTEIGERLDALEDRVDHRLAELEERVDFAERLLTKHRDESALPGGQ
jgi:hypothetical protein